MGREASTVRMASDKRPEVGAGATHMAIWGEREQQVRSL